MASHSTATLHLPAVLEYVGAWQSSKPPLEILPLLGAEMLNYWAMIVEPRFSLLQATQLFLAAAQAHRGPVPRTPFRFVTRTWLQNAQGHVRPIRSLQALHGLELPKCSNGNVLRLMEGLRALLLAASLTQYRPTISPVQPLTFPLRISDCWMLGAYVEVLQWCFRRTLEFVPLNLNLVPGAVHIPGQPPTDPSVQEVLEEWAVMTQLYCAILRHNRTSIAGVLALAMTSPSAWLALRHHIQVARSLENHMLQEGYAMSFLDLS